MAVLNTALSVIQIGAGLSLNGSTLSATQGTSVRATVNKSGPYTLAVTDYYVGYTGTGGDTFSLPNATALNGTEFIMKNLGSGTLTISAAGAGNLFTTASVTTMSLIVGEAVHVISDGTRWVVVSMASGIITP